ncbi:GntR family transcriptional regulator [Paenibacillus filicis]|uniref:GntR family transcriptional regulator n=1 Tax=Paenibacillus gyeongsangnamensis TaxID=3388067 RepID=A0ABT4QIA5_9BACL|nr:GntR family transcriptional regulator [Paenibacillus filicis]MCZ8516615.1 GntR family transcriptional regulator [Paenibacillus filicis]
MQIVKSESLHIQAYNIIKQSILEGNFEPGEHVKENKLAEKLGISRGPIREANRMLMQEGLLIQDGNQLRVFKPSFQNVVELYLIREYLESLAARLAARNMSNSEIKELSSILAKTKSAISDNDRKEIIQQNTNFHDKIILASKNEELIKTLATIRSKVFFIRNTGHLSYFRENNFIKEHEKIFEIIMAKDEAGAEIEMKLHIQKDVEKFRELFNNNNCSL